MRRGEGKACDEGRSATDVEKESDVTLRSLWYVRVTKQGTYKEITEDGSQGKKTSAGDLQGGTEWT